MGTYHQEYCHGHVIPPLYPLEFDYNFTSSHRGPDECRFQALTFGTLIFPLSISRSTFAHRWMSFGDKESGDIMLLMKRAR